MATIGEFEKAEPELAAFGRGRLDGRVAYLATVRADGSPRVHPVTPRIRDGHLFVRMYPTSPKAHDLIRDGRYALHSLVTESSGEGGEFFLTGIAHVVNDPELLAAANQGLSDQERYVVFELEAREALSTVYENDEPARRRWDEAGY